MKRFIAALIGIMTFFLFTATVQGKEVRLSSDYGRAGEFRYEVSNAQAGEKIDFAPHADPRLHAGTVNVKAPFLSINGQIDAHGFPLTRITGLETNQQSVLGFVDGLGNGLSLGNIIFSDIRRHDNEALRGGGLLSGLNDADASGARLGNISNVQFTMEGTFGSSLDGGGVVGVASNTGPARIGNIDGGTLFYGNQINLINSSSAENGRIWGGGLVGASAWQSPASIGDVSADFIRNKIYTATYINGAGLLGAFVVSGDNAASVGAVRGNFVDNMVLVETNLSGAGLVGSWSSSGPAVIGDISGRFSNNLVSAASSYMRGGGLIGGRSYGGEVRVGLVSAIFHDNKIMVGTSLGGGGILGLYSADTLDGSSRANDKPSFLGGIVDASFTNNLLTVGHAEAENVYALGGVVAVTGLKDELLVRNSLFKDNTAIITGRSLYDLGAAALYVGTDRPTSNPLGHELTLKADAGRRVEFQNNLLILNQNGQSVSRRNSIRFGREWDSATNAQLDSRADARLNIRADQGGRIILLDPLNVDMSGGKNFTMNVEHDGVFLWGGKNEISVQQGRAEIDFYRGLTVLAPDFNVSRLSVHNSVLGVNISGGHRLRMNLTGRPQTLPAFDQDYLAVDGHPVLEGVYYGLDSTAGRQWLVTLDRNGIDAGRFISPDDNLFETSLLTEGTKLYMRLDNRRALEAFSDAADYNVRRAYNDGPLIRAWNTAMGEISAASMEEVFGAGRSKPAALVAEHSVSQGLVGLKMSGVISAQALQYAWRPDEKNYAADSDRPKRPYRLWSGYIGADYDQDGTNGYSGYDTHAGGFAVGGTADYSYVSAGVYGAYARARTSYGDLSSVVKAEAFQTGLYAKMTPFDAFDLLMNFYYTRLENDSARSNGFGRYSADFNQDVYGLGLALSYDLQPGANISLTPYLGLEYKHLHQEKVKERGEFQSLAQEVGPMNADSLLSVLGFRVSRDIQFAERITITPAIHVAWKHEFADLYLTASASYSGISGTFDLRSARPDRDAAEIGLGLKALLADDGSCRFSMQAGYSAEFNENYLGQDFYGGLLLEF